MSIFRDRRPVLYAGGVSSGYAVRFDHNASPLVLLNPAQPTLAGCASRRFKHTFAFADLSHLLDAVTAFGSQLIAFPPLLLTVDDQSLAIGWRCLPSTGKVGVDDFSFSRYHLTNLDTQLSKNKRSCSLPPFPRPHRSVSGERIAPNPLHANGLAAHFLKLCCLWSRFIIKALSLAPAIA